MDEDFKKWLCEKAGIEWDIKSDGSRDFTALLEEIEISIETLIKAMWAINRDKVWSITMQCDNIFVRRDNPYKGSFHDYENGEQEALTKALQYIYEQEHAK